MPSLFSRVPRTAPELRELLRRDHTLNGGSLLGLQGFTVEIQARAIRVLDGAGEWYPRISGNYGSEGITRIQGAFARFGIPEPRVQIQINLLPSDLPKGGGWLDLPIAIIMLQAAGFLPDLPEHKEGDFVLVGEVGLHGEIRRVPGALSIAMNARPGQKLIVPSGNEKECALILAKPGHEGCSVHPVSTLDEVIEFFQGRRKLENALKEGIKFEHAIPKAPDFGLIRGQQRAKEAACIAAAGGHNLLLIGPPGEGKSFLASAIPGILPTLSDAEKVELTRIYSAYGALTSDGLAVTRRPMRSVHHTASRQSIVGGGSGLPRPGEITLSHLGVLFLDEIAEFSSSTLEALRQPLESGEVTITRVGGSLSFPSRFTLVAAMNPCPCGYFPSEECSCREPSVRAYQKKLSGPILDRIDLQVEMERLTLEERFAEATADQTPRYRALVQRARDRQSERFKGTGVPHNAAIPGGHVLPYCRMAPETVDLFKEIVATKSLSTRSMDRLAKVARTVADMANSEETQPSHLNKAAGFVVGGILREGF